MKSGSVALKSFNDELCHLVSTAERAALSFSHEEPVVEEYNRFREQHECVTALRRTVDVAHLILVDVLVVDLEGMGGQLLCFVQFPEWERTGKKKEFDV